MGTSGGCQCGAVRYAFDGALRGPHLCHCRMCQKAAGNYFLALGGVGREDFRVTRGTIARFASSDLVRRGFCRDCGTPLTFESADGETLSVTLGSLDDPAAVAPAEQHGVEGRVPWFDALARLPERSDGDATGEEAERLEAIASTNHQHPDRDTPDRAAPRGDG